MNADREYQIAVNLAYSKHGRSLMAALKPVLCEPMGPKVAAAMASFNAQAPRLEQRFRDELANARARLVNPQAAEEDF